MQSSTILPGDTATVIIASLTALIGANIGVILTLVGFGIGLSLIRKMFNRSHKGKV